jgi:TonB family protein
MVKTRALLVLLLLLVTSVEVVGTGQVADARTAQLACELRWGTDTAEAQQGECIENIAIHLKQNPRLVVYIISYAGRQARVNEARETMDAVRRHLVERKGIKARQVVALDGGFREEASVELFLARRGSAAPVPTPALEPDVVEFLDELPGVEAAMHRTRAELLNAVLDRPNPVYPPLARAGRVEGDVGVKVLVNDQGHVIAARAVYGHPLLRDSAEKAALRWRFSPSRLESASTTASGLLIFKFDLASTKPDLIQRQ